MPTFFRLKTNVSPYSCPMKETNPGTSKKNPVVKKNLKIVAARKTTYFKSVLSSKCSNETFLMEGSILLFHNVCSS